MENYSLNKVVNLIEALSAAHPQIKGFEFSEEFDISASQKENYPLLWANVLPAELSEKTLSIVAEIMIMDMVQDDNRNERDTLSDTLQIAGDMIAMLNDPAYQDYFIFSDNSTTLEPVRHVLPDTVNGWKFTIKLNTQFTANRCQIPTL